MSSFGRASAAIYRGTGQEFDVVQNDVPDPGPGQTLLRWN